MKKLTNLLTLLCIFFYCNGSGTRRFRKITTGVDELFIPIDPTGTLFYLFPALETGDPFNGCFTFKYLGPNAFYVTLSPYAERNLVAVVQIIIGGWGNIISKFRINGKDGPEFKRNNTINPNIYTTFWIKWSINSIEVGRGGESVPFMIHEANNLNPVHFIRIHTHATSSGKWIFEEPNCPNFINTLIENDSDSLINEKLLKQGNLIKQMENQVHNFNNITKNPTIDFIEFYINELLENYKKCKALNEEILVYSPHFIEDYVTGHVYENIQKLFYTFLDALYNQKKYLASENLLTAYPSLETKFSSVLRSNKSEYEYFKLNNETCVSFKIMASKNVHLTLSTEASSEIWEIFIGGWFNTKSGIIINSELVIEADTPNILSLDQFTGFQLEWSDKYFKVIKKGSKQQFLTYIGKKKLNFDKIGIQNKDAVWIFEGSTCTSFLNY